MLRNGFGEHNIQGIGDKHIPLIHDVMATDFVVAVSDRATDHLEVMFDVRRRPRVPRRPAGTCRTAILEALPSLGFSSLCNILAAIKTAKYEGYGPDDVVATVATDGAAMYGTEIERILARDFAGGFDAVDAGETFGRFVLGAGTDDLLELSRVDRDRIFNLGYFTWVEQQGVPLEEFEARRRPGVLDETRAILPGLGPADRRVQRTGRRRRWRRDDPTRPGDARRSRSPRGAAARPAAADRRSSAPAAATGARRRRVHRPVSRPPSRGRHRPRPPAGASTPARLAFPGLATPTSPGRTPDLRPLPGASRAPTTSPAPRAGPTSGTSTSSRRLDAAVAAVDGARVPRDAVRAGPGARARGSAWAPATSWVKDETANVSGSHKARHLMGVMLDLLVAEELAPGSGAGRLAIASCGNAALAAAVVARAADRALDVFVPDLGGRGRPRPPAGARRATSSPARGRRRARRSGLSPAPRGVWPRAPSRSPARATRTASRSRAARRSATRWPRARAAARRTGRTAPAALDALVVQVGGGALASAVAAGFAEARALGVIDREPRLYAVQAEGCAPLARAWRRVPRARRGQRRPSAALEHARAPPLRPTCGRGRRSRERRARDPRRRDVRLGSRSSRRWRGRAAGRSSSTRRRSSRRTSSGGVDGHRRRPHRDGRPRRSPRPRRGAASSARTRPSPSCSPASGATTDGTLRPPRRSAATSRPRGAERTMRSFLGRDILSLKDFSRDEFYPCLPGRRRPAPVRARSSQHGPAQGQDAADGVLPALARGRGSRTRPRCTGSAGTCWGSPTRR